jgi:hypothetical protein
VKLAISGTRLRGRGVPLGQLLSAVVIENREMAGRQGLRTPISLVPRDIIIAGLKVGRELRLL